MPSSDIAPSEAAEVIIRRATIPDVPHMTAIINGYAAKGIMLPRSLHQLYQSLRDFAVAVCGDEIIGCGALHIVWADLCEVRSLAVKEGWVGRGIGQRLAGHLLDEARALGLPRVFALTYRQNFFAHLGFEVVPHVTLPHKIWGDCLNCPKYPNCDEIAMMLRLASADTVDMQQNPPTNQETLP